MVIAILGLGTIGSGVFEIAQQQENITVKRILEVRFKNELTTDKIEDITSDPDIDLVVETMGGLHPAYEFATAVIESGKHFVTANKYLVSVYGIELTALARKHNCAFLYSAACGGGIAYLANLQSAHNIDSINALGGILNGTTNFILDSMQSGDMDYSDALKEAQALGYAERDPSSDVEGLDTQRKLILACGIGFDALVSDKDIAVRGISQVLAKDIAFAKANNMVIRLCANGALCDGALTAFVEPVLVAANAPEASILKNINYAWYSGVNYGLMGYTGQGAGKLPTGANIIRDIVAIDNGARYMTSENSKTVVPDNTKAVHAYYVRLPKDTDICADWIETETTDEDCRYIVTKPVSVSVMHNAFSGNNSVFFAGIRKG